MESCKQNYLPTVEIKDYKVTIDGRNFFNQPIKINLKRYDNIWKTRTGQGGNYLYFKKYYKLIAIDFC